MGLSKWKPSGNSKVDDEPIDLRGLKCPLPALFARRALERVQPSATIEILADDPMAWIDIPHMCGREGYEVIAVEREGNLVRVRMRRAVASRSGPGAE